MIAHTVVIIVSIVVQGFCNKGLGGFDVGGVFGLEGIWSDGVVGCVLVGGNVVVTPNSGIVNVKTSLQPLDITSL